jgi:5-methylcytosine-specific restriction endonuclease McrA
MAKAILICPICGTEFRDWPSQKRKYCSRECMRRGYRPAGTQTPEHAAKISAALKGRPGNPKSIEAAAAARRGKPPWNKGKATKENRGAHNGRWIDGRSYERYGPGFSRRLRRLIIARDRVCRDCGEWDDRPRGMQLHHLDGGTDDHDPANVILLCVRCHKARHREARHR